MRLAAVGRGEPRSRDETIRFHTKGQRYNYYLVWITSLGNQQQAANNELSLYK